jgi:hypothetical protein
LPPEKYDLGDVGTASPAAATSTDDDDDDDDDGGGSQSSTPNQNASTLNGSLRHTNSIPIGVHRTIDMRPCTYRPLRDLILICMPIRKMRISIIERSDDISAWMTEGGGGDNI